ncbi:HBS1 like translational GTPase [Phyllostomus discolor]|uniref:HBS1 like translational GTPase n=1 Tax=Phyllostomus discolor TaxID=89673 RepID=A0A834AG11_9CHIR|nr:HBS1 like translational GTPase [Phyllostomus discolor]
MARHRNVRGYNYDEDFEDDDLYGHSVEDDYCISPSTAAQFIYSRRDKPGVEPVDECDYEDLKESSNYLLNHQLSGFDQARLYSCLDHMREVFGDAVPEDILIEAVLKNEFNVEKALSMVLEQDKMQKLKVNSEGAIPTGKIAKGKSVHIQSSRSESEIVPKVAKMTVSGRKQTMGFEVPGVTAEENGHSFHTPQKGHPSEDTSIAASEVLETVSKAALPSHTIQASEEQSSTQTPVKKSGKLRQQIDIKAELEKRQGGKQLLNLVVIGNVLRSSGLSALLQPDNVPAAAWRLSFRSEFLRGCNGQKAREHGIMLLSSRPGGDNAE